MTTFPTVHLNGSSPTALLEQNLAVAEAAQLLLEALTDAAPNARDFYVQGPDAFTAAAREHQERAVAVKRVYDVAAAIYENVNEQCEARARQRSGT